MNLRRGLIFAATLLSSMTMLGSTAMAQASTGATPHLIPTKVVQYRAAYKDFKGDFSGDWVHCEYVTKSHSTLTWICTKTVTVIETTSATFGFSDGVISSSVGFNVAYSAGVNDAVSVKVKPGGQGWIDNGFRYSRWVVGMEKRTCIHTFILSCPPWPAAHNITVQRHLGNTFAYFGTGAE
jgi:hypothetical protein